MRAEEIILALIGIDWSGDPGMKPGSLPRCVMAVVACTDVDALDGALAELRQARSLKKTFEFHYTEIDDAELRSQFMAAVAGKVMATVAVYEKERMVPRWAWGRDTDLLVQLIIHCVMALPPAAIDGAKVVIDGDREAKALRKVLRPALSKSLEQHGITERSAKMVPGRSEDYNIVQVADMIAGATSDIVKRRAKETEFLGVALDDVTVLRITPLMEKPAK